MKNRNVILSFDKTLPRPESFGSEALLIFDEQLLKIFKGLKAWVRRFPGSYGVKAGERLKDLRRFPKHMEKILEISKDFNPHGLCIVVMGGGSVGDFGGFVASVLKRGVRLEHLPTTWLAAIDSSHGGKNALNVSGSKNQIGTFFSPAVVHIVEDILNEQPEERLREALGELCKIALLDGGEWVKKIEHQSLDDSSLFRQILSDAIESKQKIVLSDPLEKNGKRQVLNLGHTLGHVLEAEMGLPHGVAVAQGLFFSLEWSRKLGILSSLRYERTYNFLTENFGLSPMNLDASYRRRCPRVKDAKSHFLNDKKRSAKSELVFIFLKDFGVPVRKSIRIGDLLKECLRQQWIRP